jgi:hypothetical protein
MKAISRTKHRQVSAVVAERGAQEAQEVQEDKAEAVRHTAKAAQLERRAKPGLKVIQAKTAPTVRPQVVNSLSNHDAQETE